MDLDKGTLVNIVILIHMALTGMALMKLFRLKNATGGLVILSILIMMIPILGPSALIAYYNKLYTKQEKEAKKKNHASTTSKYAPSKKRK